MDIRLLMVYCFFHLWYIKVFECFVNFTFMLFSLLCIFLREMKFSVFNIDLPNVLVYVL